VEIVRRNTEKMWWSNVRPVCPLPHLLTYHTTASVPVPPTTPPPPLPPPTHTRFRTSPFAPLKFRSMTTLNDVRTVYPKLLRRIAAKGYGKGTEIYKFEKIKRAPACRPGGQSRVESDRHGRRASPMKWPSPSASRPGAPPATGKPRLTADNGAAAARTRAPDWIKRLRRRHRPTQQQISTHRTPRRLSP